MSHTPTSSTPGNASGAAAKPTLSGVRIRQRKGQAKAAAKFEPEAFRDSLLLYLEVVPNPPTNDALVTKLVQAGASLEFLKYSEQLFELLFVGGLLQPGGSYVDEKRSPFFILQDDSELGDWNPVKGIVEVLQRVIQRYRYLQKPLEETFLPDLLGYIPKWNPSQRAKLAEAVALFVADVGIQAKCLQSLAKDHVVKDGVALSFLTAFFHTYLSKQSIEHLSSNLRKSGLRDILAVFPQQSRDRATLEAHFKKEGLTQVVDWYAKAALSGVRTNTISTITRMINDEETNEVIIEHLKTQQAENPVPEADLCEWIWLGWMGAFDWTARGDQLDTNVVQYVSRLAPSLEPFALSAKAQVNVLNTAQVYCYQETRILKAFPQLVKVLYNADCVSDQAVIYWHQKGAKPQGKQHFLKVTQALVDFLEEDSEDEDE
ncbi:uncharacterized protein CcaverHIS019_0111930 [Cutaneotrichosporon cavernicola]|uniref:W2 domain-containing protein n=1 Tax=Cutaneotrichosporon cavernicola TaxID=279322 RepID=A0AA48L0P4_9TREE|nr:uncharacterized protein CcaverHIS019_0111930 [Cutaneotrichosporon cavernicola]BEI88475.1 hypothetical protein CcaverHIS019_0111930 [Cutaneotrichosporon cavernicola]BEI96248.1 hypothetical protein CcaverHIS631_0111970 [Cutaneotrichosporon cavernicola]BEJ04019.1 hypothetical protein CcaverHIS641_0111940 [Cutaneotrichosporon cavernicola]